MWLPMGERPRLTELVIKGMEEIDAGGGGRAAFEGIVLLQVNNKECTAVIAETQHACMYSQTLSISDTLWPPIATALEWSTHNDHTPTM